MQYVELPVKQLVPGDVIVLSAGNMIPADCRLLTAKDLFVAQAAMTGESMPVEKFVQQRNVSAISPLELDNILFMGTNVVSGSATALVFGTGHGTYFGTLANRVTVTARAPTSFQSGVNKVSWLLIRFMFVMSPLVFFINGFTKGDWVEALLFSLSIAVGLTPEMLPMIVTSTLAKGAVFLSRKKVIVKRLDAIQNFGVMDVLCTDKTGTLTQDKIFLSRHIDVWGEESDDVLEMAYLNSYYQTVLKNLLDVAVLEHADVHRELEPAKNFRKVDEIPFDFNRRRMSVVVAEHDERHLLISKGAVEEILAVCTRVRHGEEIEPITPDLLNRIRRVTGNLNEEGVREGRRTFANMLKYIKMTASSNFGNVLSVLVASIFLPFLPMLPMHLLVQNLLYDISQIAIPFDNVDEELLKQPQRWQPAEIGRFMVFFGPISSVFDITTFALMWFVFGAQSPGQQTLFQSGWFIVGILTQTLIVHMIRTAKLPFIESRAAPSLMVMSGIIMAVGILLPMGPFAHYFKLQALPPLYFMFLPVILLAYTVPLP